MEQENTPTQEPEQVTLNDASDTDIEAFLSNIKGQIQSEEIQETQPVQQTQQPVKQDTGDNEQKIRELELQKQKLLDTREKQSKAYQARSHELGQLRKERLELRQQVEELTHRLKSANTQESFLENPEVAVERKFQIKENENLLRQLDNDINQIDNAAQDHSHRARTTQIIEAHVKPEEFDKDAIVNTLRRDGVSDQAIQEFLQDPLQTDGLALLHLVKRSYAEKVLVDVVNYTRQLEEQLRQRQSPNGYAKMQSPMRNTMNASSGGTTQSRNFTPSSVDLTKMSNTDLDEILKQARKQNGNNHSRNR